MQSSRYDRLTEGKVRKAMCYNKYTGRHIKTREFEDIKADDNQTEIPVKIRVADSEAIIWFPVT